MQYHEVQFLGSAATQEQWPLSELPEVLFAGRSNAGKSSLINAICGRKNIAYTGKTPGKTVLLNFFAVDKRMILTDAPGYGYAKGGIRRAMEFGSLLEPYFAQRKNLKLLVLVLDIRRLPTADDLTMIQAAKEINLPILAACTKADKLSRNAMINQIKQIQKVTGLTLDMLVAVSNVKRTGIDQLTMRMQKYLSFPMT